MAGNVNASHAKLFFLSKSRNQNIGGDNGLRISRVAHNNNHLPPPDKYLPQISQEQPHIMKIALQSKLDSHSHTTCLGVHRVKKRKKQRPFFLWSIPWRRQIVAHAQRTQPHHVRPIVYESTHPKFNLEC